MGFVAGLAHTREYGETASLLLQMADEMGFDVRSVKTVVGGFEVPDALEAALTGVAIAPPETSSPVELVPPESWSAPLPAPDVMIGPGGRVYLTPAAQAALEAEAAEPVEVGRETIRAWAKENGHDVADIGKLKLAVIEAYHLAHPAD